MTDAPHIVAIVEGHGESKAVPGLLRRLLHYRFHRYDIHRLKARRANGKPDLLKKLEAYLEEASGQGCAAILVLLDADGECPREESAKLVERASALNLSVPIAIVYVRSMYETWFICSLSEGKGEEIRARLGIHEAVNAPENVESIGNAKAWLKSKMLGDQKYQETEHQEELTYHIDFELTHDRSRSFRRLCHAVEELIQAIDSCTPVVTPSLP